MRRAPDRAGSLACSKPDLNLILAARNTLASSVNDLRDLNGDEKIGALDEALLAPSPL